MDEQAIQRILVQHRNRKTRLQDMTIRDYEEMLVIDLGFSRTAAKRIAARGFRGASKPSTGTAEAYQALAEMLRVE